MTQLYKNIMTDKILTKNQLGQALRSEIAYELYVINSSAEDSEGVLSLNDDELILGSELYEEVA